MAIESIAEEAQAANPRIYGALATQAAYQIESLAMGMRDFAVAEHDCLDTLVISSTARLRELAGVLMTLASGDGKPDDALTVWGGTIESFAASLPIEVLEGGSAPHRASADHDKRSSSVTREGLIATPLEGFERPTFVTSRKTQWHVSADSARTADDLSFTSRDSSGRIVWWDVTPPKTDYWHAHEMLGRAYAFEVLDLLNNPEAEENERTLGFIMGAIAAWLPAARQSGGSGIADGFFAVIGEYVATGTADR